MRALRIVDTKAKFSALLVADEAADPGHWEKSGFDLDAPPEPARDLD